jgi:lipopolysaccharide biosynthesis glycosyltransferase
VSGGRSARVRRLLGDLRRAETRGDAVRRVRRRVAATLPGGSDRGVRPAAGPAKARPDAWYVEQWGRLARAVLGRPAGDATQPDPESAPALAAQAVRHRAEARLAEALARGEALERAACATVTELAAAEEWNTAWSIAEGLGRIAGGERAAALAHGLLLHRRQQLARAWTRFRDVDDAALATHLPVEAVDAALADGSDEARRRALAVGFAGGDLDAPTVVDLAARFFAVGEREQATALVAEARRRAPAELDERRRNVLGLLEGWLAAGPTAVPPGAVPIAIFNYRSPDHVLTSGNLGDYVQTLALLGNLARLTDVEYSGADGLGEIVSGLQARVRPELQIADVAGRVHLVTVDRDITSATDVPPGTWLIAFGWHMHPLFQLRTDFPYHPNLRPIFVSFHLNRLEMLTPDGIAYLRRHGPIGCRDWNTVFLLLSAGVDAFFSGCLTTTVDAVFPPRAEVHRDGGLVGVIDLPRRAARLDPRTTRTYSHQADAYKSMPLAEGIAAADAALAAYQRDLDRAITGRLHAYLPLTALGVPVELEVRSPGDVRFAGLLELTPGDPRLAGLQDTIRGLLAAVLARVMANATEDEVHATWRALTEPHVAEARARFEAGWTDVPTTIDIPAAVASSRAGARRFGPHDTVDRATVADVVLAFDANLLHPAAVLIESLVANASGPLRLWVLGRGIPGPYPDWLGRAFPDLPLVYLPCDGITYGDAGRPRRIPGRITISTMDRLLLPHLLEEVDRVVYLDVDTLALDDVCRLARTDLGGHPLAARDSNVSETSQWRSAGRGLPEPDATELRRRMFLRHGHGHAALNAGVLVLDLERMRRDDFTTRYLGWVEAYGLHDQDVMLAYAGPERGVLDPRWNMLPVFEDIEDPGLVHWASIGKPWEPGLTFGRERWLEHAARLHARAGSPPIGGGALAAAASDAPPGTLANPTPIGPAVTQLAPAIEQVIAGVRSERLSYLDETSLRTLADRIVAIEAEGIDGLIVETGTARGGSAIVMASAKAPGRRMKVYDVFGMIPPPGERDGEDVHRRYATIASGASKGIGDELYYGYRTDLLAEVAASFERHGLPLADHGVELIQGRFEETLRLDEPVALAHLDGDWYASTMTCLAQIAPRLAIGGRIVVDDYDTWSGCRAAVHEFFADRPGFRFERRGRLHIVRV